MKTKSKLLIVTNDPHQRFALSEFLSYEYEVFPVSNEEEGKQIFARYQQAVDVFITELHMLEKAGLDLLITAKQQYPALPLIVIKHAESPPLSEELVHREAIIYIEEPFTNDQLRNWIKHACTQKEQSRVLELIDLIQLSCISQAKVALTVTRDLAKGKEQGQIYFENGKITNALCSKHRREDALYAMMSWKNARFSSRYNIVAKYREISSPWEELVERALRVVTERRVRMIEAEPEIDLPLPEDQRKLESPQVTHQGRGFQLSRQTTAALHAVLEELQIQSENLENAIITDLAGNIISALADQDHPRNSLLKEIISKIVKFSEQASRELNLGAFDEALVISEEELLVFHPIATLGALGVETTRANQGMVRWNCAEAVTKIETILEPFVIEMMLESE